MLERTEVIFGPSSTIYGSDALGGTMVFYSKKPQLATGSNTKNINTNAMYRFSSANNESTTHVDLNFGLKSFASLTSFTYSNLATCAWVRMQTRRTAITTGAASM